MLTGRLRIQFFILAIVLKIDFGCAVLIAKSPTLGRRAFKRNVTALSHQRLDYFARAFTRTVRREIFRDAVFW